MSYQLVQHPNHYLASEFSHPGACHPRAIRRSMQKRMPASVVEEQELAPPYSDLRVKSNSWIREAFEESGANRVPRESEVRKIVAQIAHRKPKICIVVQFGIFFTFDIWYPRLGYVLGTVWPITICWSMKSEAYIYLQSNVQNGSLSRFYGILIVWYVFSYVLSIKVSLVRQNDAIKYSKDTRKCLFDLLLHHHAPAELLLRCIMASCFASHFIVICAHAVVMPKKQRQF